MIGHQSAQREDLHTEKVGACEYCSGVRIIANQVIVRYLYGRKQKRLARRQAVELLVAGTGFEPVTFGL